MKSYIAQRLAVALLTLLGMSVVIFVLLRLAPGDIVDILFAAAGYIDPQEKQAILKELGMDRPYWVQYLEWIRGIASGELGKSYRYELPTWQLIRPLLPVTLELAALAIVIAVLLGVPTGVISAVRQDSTLDYVLRIVSLAGLSMPSFWLAMVIILGLVAWFGWIPPMIYVSPTQNLRLHALQFLLPALAVGYRSSALIMRITRSSLLEVLREDYIRTARAKGQVPRVVVWRHALKNAMLPVVTVIGIEFAFMIGGLVVTETVFNLPRGALPRPGDPVARLPHGAEPGDAHRHRGHPGEPGGRPPLRRPGPARALWELALSRRPGGALWSRPGRPRRPVEPLGRFVRKKPLGAAGAAIMGIIIATAVFAGLAATHDPVATDAAHTLARPSAAHWLGTDNLGRALLAHRPRRARLADRGRGVDAARLRVSAAWSGSCPGTPEAAPTW